MAHSTKVTPAMAPNNGLVRADEETAAVAREPLLQPAAVDAGGGGNADADDGRSSSGGFPWLLFLAMLYLTLTSVMALHRCWPDRGAAAFVVAAYADLVALFFCLRRYEVAEPGSSVREWMKRAVWLLTSALTLLFSYKVAAVMPVAVAAVVWLMGLATVCGGFLAFFCFQKKGT